jgi:hypothetical protein
MIIKNITLTIPSPAAINSPALAQSKSTPPIRKVLGVSLAGQNIVVEVDCDETQPPVACDWFVVKNGQTRPPSSIFNQVIKLTNGVPVRIGTTCMEF